MRLKKKKRLEKTKKVKKTKVKKKKRHSRVPKVILFGGWSLLIFSVGFGVYNNITAVSTHTVHEKLIVEEQLTDTTGLQSYAKEFAKTYFNVSPLSKDQMAQKDSLNKYFSENLNYSTALYKEVKENVTVKDVEIWGISKVKGEKNVYSVLLKMTLETGKKIFERAYAVDIYVKNNQYAVVKLPVLATLPDKATVEVAQPKTTNIEATTRENVEGFLETFFTVYPKADEKELVYYGENLRPVKDNLTFLEITNAQMSENAEIVEVSCVVIYKDNDTKLILEMPYSMTLEKLTDQKFSIKELR